MSFNAKKCSVLTVTQKKKPITTDYTMSGEILVYVDQQTYLGVELTKDLDWGLHIQKITAKASKTVNMARRNLYSCSQKIKESAYISLVQPTLEYAQTVWDPYQCSHIDQVERFQRKAVRFVSGNCSRTASVTSMREALQWPTLHQRRCVARLTVLHKTQNNMSAVNIPDYIRRPSRPLRRQHDQSFINIQSATEQYRSSFFPRTIKCWNLLPSSLVQIATHTHLFNLVSLDLNQWWPGGSQQITGSRHQDTNWKLQSTTAAHRDLLICLLLWFFILRTTVLYCLHDLLWCDHLRCCPFLCTMDHTTQRVLSSVHVDVDKNVVQWIEHQTLNTWMTPRRGFEPPWCQILCDASCPSEQGTYSNCSVFRRSRKAVGPVYLYLNINTSVHIKECHKLFEKSRGSSRYCWLYFKTTLIYSRFQSIWQGRLWPVWVYTTLYGSAAGFRSIQKMCAIWEHGLTSKKHTKSVDIFLQIKCQPNIHQRRWYDMRSEDCSFHRNQIFGRRIDYLFVYVWTSEIGHFES